MKAGNMQCQTYTVDEYGEIVGIGRNAAYDSVRRGEVEIMRVGKRILVLKGPLHRKLDGETEAD